MATPMVLNLGLSGQPFSGPDLGGYKGTPDADLFANWMAVGVFYPFSRNHTEVEAGDQEPWAFGKEVEDVSRVALNRRYRLMPYLYTLFHEASTTGLPVMRPVFFADPADESLRSEDNAFTWGSDLMIVPRWAENVAMPKGIWNKVTVLEDGSENDSYQPDLLQRGGSIIPIGKLIQSTEEFALDSVTLLVCLNEEMTAEGKLYNDAGNGFEYKTGDYELTKFTASVTDNNLVVSWKQAEGNQVVENRFYRLGVVGKDGISYSEWENDSEIEISIFD